ncbi:GTP 3',8-cyclase MoaA [Thiohalorhabdus sp.]|uniref:GTP 3',8-cyclase MoaA n=1 Tax=Thiohalorhabdus sp. TaxID=3094134 RepID=UPI002FC2B4CB
MTTHDTLARPLRDLRISVTDRCNFRCVYCMPKELFGSEHAFLPRSEILSFEEITRLARLFAAEGVRKLRITGGEPLVRHDIEQLIGMLADIPGIDDITLTTNASLLTPQRAATLRDAGLNRVTASLDAIDGGVFRRINDVDYPVARVLEGIEAAGEASLGPVKVNMVVKRGLNHDQILPMADHFRGSGHILRFIEFMDVGNSNGWRMADVVTAAEIRDTLATHWPIESLDPNYTGEVASRYRYGDGGGEVGIIPSVTEPFCGTCTRARLSAQGELFTCLFADGGYDFRHMLRQEQASDEAITRRIQALWSARADRYSELRTAETAGQRKVEMSFIGG